MLRKYQPADDAAVVEVWAQASALAHPYLSHEFLDQERRNISEVYLPNAETWVWEAEGRVVGFLSLLGNEIGGLFVEPACHRSGIGRALLDHARALQGTLEVEVFVLNRIGRAFYAKAGFVPLHQKVHAETGFEVLRLRLPALLSTASTTISS